MMMRVRKLLPEGLASEGYVVKAASNRREALAMLMKGFRPCLILLDLSKPIMDGWQFCAEQHKRLEMIDLPVVIMSAAQNLQIDQPPCRPAAVIPKPFDLDQVVRRVATIAA
jgi:CheY-like chemotaxis protein